MTFTLARRQRQLPVPRVGVQRPDADHPGRLRRRARPSTQGPNGTGAWKLKSYNQRDRRDVRAQRRLVGRQDAARRHRVHLLRRRPARWSPPTRATRSTRSSSSTSCRARRSSTTRTSASSPRRRRSIARSGCARDTGQFADKRVRQALALTFDRPALIQQLFKGKAELGNDHVIWQGYPYFDASVPQRAQDIDKAKALLAEAGATEPDRDPPLRPAPGDPGPRGPAQEPGRPGRDHPERRRSRASTRSTARSGAPPSPADPPCSGAAELGIVDYGHRATPDVYLNAALKSKGIWNSSQYNSPAFDAAFTEFQTAVGVDAQKAACTKIETILNDEVPIGLPYFYNYLAGNVEHVQGRLLQRPRADVLLGGVQGRLTPHRRGDDAIDAVGLTPRIDRLATG